MKIPGIVELHEMIKNNELNIDKLIKDSSKFKPKKFRSNTDNMIDLIDREKFADLISKCDLLITHGGVGSIITGLQHNKKVIVAPRLAKYDEHMNDHQLQITTNFANAGYVLPLYEDDDLGVVLEKAKKFKPKKFRSNTSKMVRIIDEFINGN